MNKEYIYKFSLLRLPRCRLLFLFWSENFRFLMVTKAPGHLHHYNEPSLIKILINGQPKTGLLLLVYHNYKTMHTNLFSSSKETFCKKHNEIREKLTSW